MSTDPKAAYIAAHGKSKTACFFLTLFFGPLGLLYCGSWLAALLLTVVAIAAAATIVVPIACWLLSIVYGFFAVGTYNTKLAATADLMQSNGREKHAGSQSEYSAPPTYTPPSGPAGTKGELAGTFADDRPETIKSFCSPGDNVILQREPDNAYDSNAISASIIVGGEPEQIGYIKTKAAAKLAARMDDGTRFSAYVHRVWAPEDWNKPNVTIAWYPTPD